MTTRWRPADEFRPRGESEGRDSAHSRRGIMTEPKTYTLGRTRRRAARTVVTYDPRGVERSQRTDDATESTPEEHADDLHRLISALDAGPVDVFASSGGAVNALAPGGPPSRAGPDTRRARAAGRSGATGPRTGAGGGRGHPPDVPTSSRVPTISLISTPSAPHQPASFSPPERNPTTSWPTAPQWLWPNGSGRHPCPSPATTADSSAVNTVRGRPRCDRGHPARGPHL